MSIGCEPGKNPVRILKNFESDRLNYAQWLALAIGNTRLHWAWFRSGELVAAWDLPYLEPESATIERVCQAAGLPLAAAALPLYVASVVPTQTALWQTYPQAHQITLPQIPLRGLYTTLGIDRALAVLGVAVRYGLPALVIDGGTALTFSGANAQQEFVGGAILPGLALQRRSLSDQTAALPLVQPQANLPPRWAKSTAEAIQSGIFYTVLAGIREFVMDWQQAFGEGAIVLTGGDALLLMNGLQSQNADLAQKITIDPHLVFWGIQAIVEQNEK